MFHPNQLPSNGTLQNFTDPTSVAALARLRGDARRGALLFYTSAAACVKCHASGPDASPLGPDLTTIAKEATDQYIVEAILDPSKVIRKGFESVSVMTVDGQVRAGLIAKETKEELVLRDAANLEKEIRILRSDIDEIKFHQRSMMPDYRWSKQYGSDQYSVLEPGEKGRDPLSIENAQLMNVKTIRLDIPELRICDQVSLEMNFKDFNGNRFVEHVYLTVHAMPE